MSPQLLVTKRDGTKEPFNADKVNKSIERACAGLDNWLSKVTQIATETELTLYEGVTEEELDEATINAALQNVQYDPDYDTIATRLLLKTIYKRVLGEYDRNDVTAVASMHKDKFAQYVLDGISAGLLDPRMAEKFNLDTLAGAINVERDNLFKYAGLSTFINRYSLKGVDLKPIETPQFFFMRIAMGLSYNEEDPTKQAIDFYDRMSQLRYIAGGSTNIGAGTIRPSLSNCFLLQIEDDMEHISKSVADIMMISKATGGLGASLTKLRASGSPLASSNTVSSGPTPFAKIIDTAIRAVQRGGKKKGALCFYMENWHLDFPDYIDWKHNAGDDYLRMRTANTAAFISDEFMKRVQTSAEWYLFDPKEVPDLVELYGDEFSKRYQEYIEKADRGEIRMWKKMPALELMKKMIVALQGTSHPWLTWKDTINNRALNNNTGTIHMSNLCTEICLPQDRDNIAVCNLASLNLVPHVLVDKKDIDWTMLEDTIRVAIRHLDNLIDINLLPIAEARKSDQENRAVGLGVMGFADVFEKMGWPYDSEESYNFTDKVCEFISYIAIDESAELAKVRGSYKHFEGSRWSKGMVPFDSLISLEENRGVPLTVTKEKFNTACNWDMLREKVKKGMRNATLLAVAPNANIGLLAGTVPGFDVRFAQVFSRNKISGKYLDINFNLVHDLKKIGMWESVQEKIIGSQGDISNIEEIPIEIREVYKTSFSTSPYGVIEIAARAQKWIDQAISRNMYLETRDTDDIIKIYTTAWEKGLKSTYYCHMKPRHTAEQSTTTVNKRESLGKTGFASLRARAQQALPETIAVQASTEIEHNGQTIRVWASDPSEQNQCDSCQ